MKDFINFDVESIKEKLNTKILGRDLIYLKEIYSTQEYIKDNLKNNLQERFSCDSRKPNKRKRNKWKNLAYNGRGKSNLFLFA